MKRHQGHIRQQSLSSYRVKVNLGKNTATGKYQVYQETVKGNSKTAAARLREILTELDKGIFVKPGKTTLGEYLNAWLTDYVKSNLAIKTHEQYSYVCVKHTIPTLGNVQLFDLRPTHLQHLYAEKQKAGLSNRTVQLIHVILHKALNNAVKSGLISRNVCDAVDAPKSKRRLMRTMSEAEIQLFLEMARDTEYYSLFYTLLFTGLRRNEALALRWSDVDLLLCQLSVIKSKTNGSRRMVALSPSNVAVLQEHREAQDRQREALNMTLTSNSDFVFCHYDGKPLLPNSVTHAWIKLARRCGLDGARLHDARHTHASLLLKQGVHPKIVQERLGHAGIAITLDLYSHVTPGLQEAAADKFDRIFEPEKEENIKPNVSKMLAKDGGVECRPYRSRTCDTLIKSQGVLV